MQWLGASSGNYFSITSLTLWQFDVNKSKLRHGALISQTIDKGSEML
jgi:hypothetical protein